MPVCLARNTRELIWHVVVLITTKISDAERLTVAAD